MRVVFLAYSLYNAAQLLLEKLSVHPQQRQISVNLASKV